MPERTSRIRCTMLIFLCFLLTSTGWLSWEYHLMGQVSPAVTDICAQIIGYLLQAAGIGLHALLLFKGIDCSRRIFPVTLLLHLLCMIPAVCSPYVTGTLIFGFLMNLTCGVIAGQYLLELARDVEPEHKATAFGIGYGLSALASWLLSLIAGGALYYSERILFVAAVLTGVVIWMNHAVTPRMKRSGDTVETAQETPKPAGREQKFEGTRILWMAGLLVLLLSVVNGSGFAFPSGDLGTVVHLELLRLVYAVGLVIAGYVTDRSRQYGAVCALAALMVPFVILAMRGETGSVRILWMVGYFIFGFYAVYRSILFSDIAAGRKALHVSAFGLMCGRIGDAVGEGICIALSARPVVLVLLTAILFLVTVVVFFAVYHRLYLPMDAQEAQKERFVRFALQHDLSARERELLQLLLQEHTNAEIADTLSISENTVKFHVKNILQKTGCRNRKDLLAAWQAYVSA